jgi:hypothetical protein
VEEHHLDTVGVGSSILPVPTALPAGPIPARAAFQNGGIAADFVSVVPPGLGS